MTTSASSLRSVWASGSDFLEQYEERDPPRFFCPIGSDRNLPPQTSVGTVVSVVVVFEDRNTQIHVHARVLDRRQGTEKRGLTLELLPEERDRIELLLLAARGASIPYRRRRHTRVPGQWPCELVTQQGTTLTGETTNINEGGLHVTMTDKPALDELVRVTVKLPDQPRLELRARVVNLIADGPQRGVALEFQFSSAEQRDQVRAAIGRVRSKSSKDG